MFHLKNVLIFYPREILHGYSLFWPLSVDRTPSAREKRFSLDDKNQNNGIQGRIYAY
jgi:hypothetical protein